jgi:hypothetical protein
MRLYGSNAMKAKRAGDWHLGSALLLHQAAQGSLKLF